MIDLQSYDYYIVASSGGKDSLASFLWLLENGVPRHKIELWHHLVDGINNRGFMDWPVTESYCQALGKAFGVPVYLSWLEGGFEREMLRKDQAKAATFFQTPEGLRTRGGQSQKTSTRLMFPQVSADLNVRWCSGYLKIDVCDIAIKNQTRFEGKRTLVISGERGEESAARAGYESFEGDRSATISRMVHRLRPIKDWKEQQVWQLIEKYKVIVHPCYYIGFSRCSCQFCIFSGADQMATAYILSPDRGSRIYDYEQQFGKTMKRNQDFASFVYSGKVYNALFKYPQFGYQAIQSEYVFPIFTNHWVLPAGAYGKGTGPS